MFQHVSANTAALSICQYHLLSFTNPVLCTSDPTRRSSRWPVTTKRQRLGSTATVQRWKSLGAAWWLVRGLYSCIQLYFPIHTNIHTYIRTYINTIQYNTVQIKYNTNTIQYNIIQYNTILYFAILHYTILYYTILYDTILYYTILLYTILYHTLLYYTILYYTIRYVYI